MSRLARALRSRREKARHRRSFQRALEGASPALRDELITMAQRQGGLYRNY